MRNLPGLLRSAAPTGLLERGNELVMARIWLDDVRAERGRMLLVEAPRGLGKSALIEQVREVARGEFTVLSAAGSELEQEFGWGVPGRCSSRGCGVCPTVTGPTC